MDIAVVGLIQAVAVAIIAGLFNREAKKRKKEAEKSEKRNALRAEEGLLSMKLMNANTDLTVATAIAVRDSKCNGEMSSAMEKAKIVQREYYEFINQIATKQIAEE